MKGTHEKTTPEEEREVKNIEEEKEVKDAGEKVNAEALRTRKPQRREGETRSGNTRKARRM